MQTLLKKIDLLLDRHLILLLSLLLLVVLRVPNFFDPYWYGDEAIYLTLGQSIRAGRALYTGIVDHKTPIIYYLATVPNQFSFRLLLTFWMIITTTAFYQVARRLIAHKLPLWLCTIGFVLLTTLPTFEGHIPNGELFVMGFVMVGMWILSSRNYLASLLNYKDNQPLFTPSKKQQYLIVLAGVFLGFGFLTKVPSLLDTASVMFAAWLAWISVVLTQSIRQHKLKLSVISLLSHWLPLVVGFLLPVIFSVIYFVLVGSGNDYLRFGLLYNLHYTQTWSHDFGSSLLNFLFTLPGKTTLLALLMIVLSVIKKIPTSIRWSAGWYILSFFAVLLSNRPYPHYWIQAVPALVLLIGLIFDQLLQDRSINNIKNWGSLILIGGLIALTVQVMTLLNFAPYSTTQYYRLFYKYISGKVSQQQYYLNFNPLMNDNYQLAQFLKNMGETKLFIWGNNPMLYALSQTIPSSRFIVAFHVQDMNAYDETIRELINDKPEYVVLMNDAPTDFPDFYRYLEEYYSPNLSYQYMTLFKRNMID